MFYIVEEIGREPDNMVRYSICTTFSQANNIVDASDFTIADIYGPFFLDEAKEWMRDFLTMPKNNA